MNVELIDIGYVIRTHGVKGHLRIRFNDNIRNLSVTQPVFFSVKGHKIPYFITEISYFENGDALVRFEDVHTPEEAWKLTRHHVFGDPSLAGHREQVERNFTGYEVLDTRLGLLGKVSDWYAMQEYDMVEIPYRDRKVLIPLSDDILLKVEPKKHTIYVSTPDGLLDL